MKYKIGDKVRVRKDLEVGNWYGKLCIIKSMRKLLGKEVTIKKTYDDFYIIEENESGWTDEMLEPVEDIIEYKGKKYDVVKQPIIVGIETLNQKTLKKFDKLIFLKEHKEEILDEEEKRYLSAVIKPFRNKVNSILKVHNLMGYFIVINNYGCLNDICLPEFKDKRMYKGMELDKEYTLEELGL